MDGSLLGIATKRHENHCFAEALKNKQDLAPLRVVVEKELLHHDIMLALSSAGMLAKLTFIGDTCLRACYGSNRLSEDLDFTGGADFNRESLTELAHVLVTTLKTKYGLEVLKSVSLFVRKGMSTPGN
ncbi:nucleotidyl transferase AbiEii/AbiGii toxin family protein [Pseudomonas sp. JV414]|uniref:nucleotidyl transferase AbiEii/AbiGii toxin family protein n=1 Tax=Pseudomonas sp. JV414 TaxID=1733110 RepID=UPI0028F41095|nr:nucleotidyl transferase AbiEii/AbiGii toxin family protein [Pseudomonas sp. JV414]